MHPNRDAHPPMIVDAHQDIAYAAWVQGRDFLRSAHDKRAAEAAADPERREDICTVGLPDMQRGGIGLAFGSIFVRPADGGKHGPQFTYTTAEQAHAQALIQWEYYQNLAQAGHITLIRSCAELAALERQRQSSSAVGLLVGLEGADPILDADDVWRWHALGVRHVGLAWAHGSRYCGGNRHPGPLTADAPAVLRAMEQAGLILDLSHLAEESFWQALEIFGGHVIASHANCRALVPGERQLSDDMIRAIAERGGVIGVVFYNRFLRAGWEMEQGKSAVTLADVTRHIDHICQLLGSAAHVGIGSDLDGGFGWEATPAEIDTVADLARLGPVLTSAGYAADDVECIVGGNWLRVLRAALPQHFVGAAVESA